MWLEIGPPVLSFGVCSLQCRFDGLLGQSEVRWGEHRVEIPWFRLPPLHWFLHAHSRLLDFPTGGHEPCIAVDERLGDDLKKRG